MQNVNVAAPRPNLRTIALPKEHGGWSFVLEPIVLGLWIAPSRAGALLGLAAFSVFLIRHPAELAFRDWQRGKSYPRTIWALRFAAGFGVMALLALSAAFLLAAGSFWQPLALALPLAAVQLYYDIQRMSREVVAEIFGALALAGVAPAMVMADKWSLGLALAVWGILAARIITSILYVRARLRLERGEAAPTAFVQLAHVTGLIGVLFLAIADKGPWLAVFALAILLARSLYGLSRWRVPTPRASIIGIQEVIFGIVTVVLVAIGDTL